MKKATIAINTKLPRQDAYGAIAMPVYHTAAYEFEMPSVAEYWHPTIRG